MRRQRTGLFALLTLALVGVTPVPSWAQSFSDSDWNQTFRANCPLPSSDAVRFRSVGPDQKLAFTLRPGDVGGCSSDSKPRHGARYWERAELKQAGTLALGQKHTIRFEATFAEGFRGQAETFFQIHAWSSKCKSAPLLMLQFDKKKLKTHVLQRTSNKFQSGISRGSKGALAEIRDGRKHRKELEKQALNGGTHDFQVIFDTRKRVARMTVQMDGVTLVENERVHLQRCVQPHVKVWNIPTGKAKQKTFCFAD